MPIPVLQHGSLATPMRHWSMHARLSNNPKNTLYLIRSQFIPPRSISSHCISSHVISSHRIASHLMPSQPIASRPRRWTGRAPKCSRPRECMAAASAAVGRAQGLKHRRTGRVPICCTPRVEFAAATIRDARRAGGLEHGWTARALYRSTSSQKLMGATSIVSDSACSLQFRNTLRGWAHESITHGASHLAPRRLRMHLHSNCMKHKLLAHLSIATTQIDGERNPSLRGAVL